MASAKDILSRWRPDPRVCGPVADFDDKPKMMRRRELDRERRVFFARRIITTYPAGSAGMAGFMRSFTDRHGERSASMIRDDIGREMALVKYKPTEEEQRLHSQSDRRYAPRREDIQDEFVVDPEVNQEGLSRMKTTLNQAIASIRGRKLSASESEPAQALPRLAGNPDSFVITTALRNAVDTKPPSTGVKAEPAVEPKRDDKRSGLFSGLNLALNSNQATKPLTVSAPVLPSATDRLAESVSMSGSMDGSDDFENSPSAEKSMIGFAFSDY